jgi:hypothetical protein
MNGLFHDYHSTIISQLVPSANSMIVTCYHLIQDLSREITLSLDSTGMHHELMYHFVYVLCKIGDHGYTRNAIQSFLIKMCDARRVPRNPQQVVPFTYHDVLSTLRLADIKSFTTALSRTPPISGHDRFIAAAQMRPHHSPSGPTDHHPSPDRTPNIRCEVCLDRFRFPPHDAPWCPFIHDENICDREVCERAIQFRIQHIIKHAPLPDGLQSSMNTPPHARLPAPTVRTATVTFQDTLNSDTAALSADFTPDDTSDVPDIPVGDASPDPIVDSALYDYHWDPVINSASDLVHPADTSTTCPFEYQSLQE